MPKEYLTLYHHDRSVKTLSQYMEKEHIQTSVISVKDLFDYNRDLIFKQMSVSEKASYAKSLKKKQITAKDLKSDMTLPCPCIMKIKAKLVDYELSISQTNFEVQTDNIYAFQNEQIQNIIQNEGYIINNETKKIAPDCSVFGWFKSLYYVGTLDGFDTLGTIRTNNNKFIDVSDYIVNLQTNVTSEGGTFSIEFPIINSIEDFVKIKPYDNGKSNKWTSVLKNLSYTDRKAKMIDVYRFGKYYYHKASLNAMDQNFFNWLVQSNDLIFISFETLQMEKDLGGKVFDMIGLVDDVVVNQNANGKGSVTVSGRDLMKLLTDDSSLFFNTSTVWGQSQIFVNTESAGKQGDIRNADMVADRNTAPINRLRRSTNEIDPFADPFNRSIDYVMKGVISQLANIEVVPSYVFESWGDRRTRFAELYPSVSTGGSGRASGGSSGSGSGEGTPQLNKKDFNSMGQNTNKDKYSPIQGGSSGQRNSDTPRVPVPASDDSKYIMKDGVMIKVK